MSDFSERTGFVEAVSWMGAPPYRLLVYVVCPNAVATIVTGIEELWPETTGLEFFRICDADWPFEIALVEIQINEVDASIDGYICETLRSLSEHFDTPCVFMFEDGFSDYRNLFKPESQVSVYGICVPGVTPFVGTIDQARSSAALSLYLHDARALLVARYPEVDVPPVPKV